MKKPSPPSSGLRRRLALGPPVGMAGGEGARRGPRSRGRAASRWHRRGGRRASPWRRRRRGSRPAAAGSAASSAGVSRHLPSGLRRQAPVPEQGASASTRSQTGFSAAHSASVRMRTSAAGAAGALGQIGHPPRVDVPGHQPAAALQRRGQRQGLAAAAGAVVEHGHARARRRRSRRRAGSRRPAARPCPGCRRGWPRRAAGSPARAARSGRAGGARPARRRGPARRWRRRALVFSVLTRRSTGARGLHRGEHRLEVGAERGARAPPARKSG